MILYPAVSKKNVITYNMNNDTSDIVFLKWTVHAENIWRATFCKIKLVQIATSRRFVITPGRSKARYVSPWGDPYHFFFFHENPLVHLMIQTISFVTLNNFRKVKPHDDKLGLITIHQIIYPSLLIMPIWSWRDFSKAPLRFYYAQLSLFTQLMHGIINSGKMESGCMSVFSLCQSL